MAIMVDSRQQAAPFSAMGYGPMRYQASPHFSDPWVSSAASSHGSMYATALPAVSSSSQEMKHYPSHTHQVSSAYTASTMPPAPTLATGMLPLDPELMDQSGLQMAQDLRPYGISYTSAPTTAVSYTPTATAPQYASSYGYPADRRSSHPSVVTATFLGDPMEVQRPRQNSLVDFNDRFNHVSEADRQSYTDALDASRGMVAMSQSDVTPRNIYGNGNGTSSRSSMDSYGFPASHSTHSSISSASAYSSYYPSSVSEASVGDYSSASESVDMPTSRTLPRPTALINSTLPPAPQSMMGQFSSKVSSSSQKKHKCKICDKRFTRPSSLQTHMYSHTGEKPFACEVEGCGRHFSVVSNLRRHRKVHRGEGRDHPSPDDDE